MPETEAGQSPPKPPFALAIGVVGHKPDRLAADPEALRTTEANIRRKVDEILAAIAVAANTAQDRHQAAFSDEPVLFVVSALAEGADTIVAKAALDRKEKDFVLNAPLPFSVANYAQDFPAGTATRDYDELRGRARAVLALPGERKAPGDTDEVARRKVNRAYEAVGLTVLSQSDIVLAIWDGGPSRGRGGTVDMLNAAARSGTPVIHVDTKGESASLRWNGLDRHPVSVSLLEDLKPIPIDSALLERLVDRLIAPPEMALERDALDAYFAERPERFNPRCEYPLLQLACCVKGLSIADVRPDQPGVHAARLAAFMAPAEGRIDAIAAAYGWADAVGIRFAQRFRSAFVANFLLAALAVVLAVVSLHFHDQKPLFVFVEIILILLVMWNTSVGQEGRWQRRWVEGRELAERLRAATLLWSLGARPASIASVEPTWTGWYVRALLRAQGMRTGTLADGKLDLTRKAMIDLLHDQCRYHVATIRRMHKLEHRLEKFGHRLFLTTFAAAVAFVIAKLMMVLFGIHLSHEADSFVAYTVTIVAAGLPALATATYGIRVIGDFEGIARRSIRTRAALRRVITALRQDPSDLGVLRARANEASEAMLGDVSSWRLSAESRGLAIPG